MSNNSQASHQSLQDEIAARKRVEAELSESEAQLHELSLRLFQAQENERSRLAYELHDEIGQDLTILKLNLQTLLNTFARDAALVPNIDQRSKLLVKLTNSYDLSEKLLEHVRDLSLNLRPTMLDNLGLAPTLRWYLGRLTESTNLEVQFHVPDDFGRLPSNMETVFFRVAQEAITNVIRHAQAKNLWVQLARRSDSIEMHITDDGVGFEFSSDESEIFVDETLELRGMSQRASIINGQLEIETSPDKGTRVSLIAIGGHEDITS